MIDSGLGRRTDPFKRTGEPEILVAETLLRGERQAEDGEHLISLGTSDQNIVPEHVRFALPSLDGNPETVTARGGAFDLRFTEDGHEPLLGRPLDIVAELDGVLVAPLAGVRTIGEGAIGDDLTLREATQDRLLLAVPVDVPVAVVDQRVLAI